MEDRASNSAQSIFIGQSAAGASGDKIVPVAGTLPAVDPGAGRPPTIERVILIDAMILWANREVAMGRTHRAQITLLR
jgi:hypothetical protein